MKHVIVKNTKAINHSKHNFDILTYVVPCLKELLLQQRKVKAVLLAVEVTLQYLPFFCWVKICCVFFFK